MVKPTFVEFSRQGARTSDEPMFTVQRRGNMSLNQAAFKALAEPAAVALLYDADHGIVGFRKVARNYPNGYQVRKQANSNSYIVGAKAFTTHNKIPCDVPHRFNAHDYGDGVWGFALSEGTEVKTSPRIRVLEGD